MRVAIIDLGTNSVRFDVHLINDKGKTKLLHREKLMIRLGQGVFLKGKIDPDAAERALDAFEHFRRLGQSLKCGKIVAFGTSALREAQDGAAFVEKIRERTGIELRVISGKEEAQLIALGVLQNERPPQGSFALVDIGGGSTEISICRGRKTRFGESFPLGTARLQQVFLKRSPPKAASVQQLRSHIRGLVQEHMRKEKWPGVQSVLASSGTAKAVAKMLDGSKGFSKTELSHLVAEMETMTTTELLDVPGMEAKRVDMVLAGAILLEEILETLGAKRVLLSEYSLRDGIIEEERLLARQHKTSHLELHLEELVQRALAFGVEEAKLRPSIVLAGELFDRLRPLHRLENRWRIYLLATMIFRNCGNLVGYVGREKHAHYIVKNLDIPAMETWEHEFVASLCLLQSSGKVGPKELAALGGDKKRREAFRKLLALVRVLVAIDGGFALQRISITRSAVKLGLRGRGGVDQLMPDRKKKLFEDVFGRQLFLEGSKKR